MAAAFLQVAGIAKNYGPLVDRAPERQRHHARDDRRGPQAITAVDYNTAVEMRQVLNAGLDQIFGATTRS